MIDYCKDDVHKIKDWVFMTLIQKHHISLKQINIFLIQVMDGFAK